MHTAARDQQGHLPTLLVSFLHFDMSFMLWVVLGALGVHIAAALNLNASQKALVVAVPILSGALLRVPLGMLGDRVGAKPVGVGMLVFLFVPLALGWRMGESLPGLVGVGLLLGVAGASFAVALPLACRWYPPERQGLVMGIAAAGNSGTVIANLVAPRLADAAGWHNVLGLAMLPLAVVLAAFLLAAKDSPKPAAAHAGGRAARVLRQTDLWWFCGLYAVTFGGYVGLSSFLPIFLHDQYGASAMQAGYLTALAAFVGSAVRPIGGYLGDRFGGVRTLSVLLLAAVAAYAALAALPTLWLLMAALVVSMACLGMGNGAVFQLVPRRFPLELGAVTGLVGACGGLGGFLVPNVLGNVRALSGSFAPGFVALAACALCALLVLRRLAAVHDTWRMSWRPAGMAPANGAPVRGRVLMAPYLQA